LTSPQASIIEKDALAIQDPHSKALVERLRVPDWTEPSMGVELLPGQRRAAIDLASEVANNLPFGHRRIAIGVASGSQRRNHQKPFGRYAGILN
jgi:hypothetical protein